jgi:NADH-quinone oxidoreductase subunit C
VTTALTGHEFASELRGRFPGAVVDADAQSVWVIPESVGDLAPVLRDDPAFRFDLLSSVSAVDYVEYFEVVYHLTSIERNASAILKAKVYGRDDLELPSVVGVWTGALLQEREINDLMGVRFSGHPNMKRLFLWEGFEGHPLRRDYLEPPLPYTWPHGG